MSWLALLLHAALMAVSGVVLEGVLRRAVAVRAGQAGPPVAQPWHDLRRLWRKIVPVPVGASFVAAAAPAMSIAAAAVAAVVTPSFTLGMATAGTADLVVLTGLLALSRAALALAGHDAGSAASGLASGRAMVARLGAAPVLLLAALALLLLSGGTNLDAAAAAVRDGGKGVRLGGLLVGAALFLLAPFERATQAQFGGRQQAIVLVAAQLRFVTALSLAAAVALPFGLAPAGSGLDAWVIGLACWALKLGALGVLAAAIGPHRLLFPAAAMLALIAIAVAGVQGAA